MTERIHHRRGDFDIISDLIQATFHLISVGLQIEKEIKLQSFFFDGKKIQKYAGSVPSFSSAYPRPHFPHWKASLPAAVAVAIGFENQRVAPFLSKVCSLLSCN